MTEPTHDYPGWLTLDGVRHVLLWLSEQQAEKPMIPCGRCGHDFSVHHATEDDTASYCEFPKSIGGPIELCLCTQFQDIDLE